MINVVTFGNLNEMLKLHKPDPTVVDGVPAGFAWSDKHKGRFVGVLLHLAQHGSSLYTSVLIDNLAEKFSCLGNEVNFLRDVFQNQLKRMRSAADNTHSLSLCGISQAVQ